ncbi:MAG TPA: hypothetical protein VFS43_33950 [Polyangiaceae bacterium]|nr:hypothetical protein [Polyangiaceae bacterium]
MRGRRGAGAWFAAALLAAACSPGVGAPRGRPARPAPGPSAPAASAGRTPAPGGPPPAPASVAAQAASPFAVRIAWEADARAAAGFEIAVESNGAFVRAALVGPTERAFVHHHRLPGRAYAYRVRAFNARGASAPVGAAATTPGLGPPPAGAPPPPPCTRLPPAPDPAKVRGLPREVLNAGGGRPLYNDPEGTNGWRRHLYGEYEGCVRDFGAFDLQAEIREVPGFADEGFPLLRAVAGAGQYAGARVVTLRFTRGRYAVADVADFCGDPRPEPDPPAPGVGAEGAGDDLAGYAPPFDACQRE